MTMIALSLVLFAGCRHSGSTTVSAAESPNGQAGPVGSASVFNPRFGARNPRKCRAVTTVPTADQIPALLQCSMESQDNFYNTLIEDVQVQVGAMRPYAFKADSQNQDIDTTAKLLTIRGSLVRYTCRNISQLDHDPSKICTRTPETKASGVCYKNTFGEWTCTMHDYNGVREAEMPPPKFQ